MVELAKRVSDESTPRATTSVWSAVERASIRSATAPNCSCVRMSSMLSLPSLPHHADLDVAHAHCRRAVPHVGRLRWLALPAVRRAPDRPLLADGVNRAPEARRDTGVGAVLQ